MNQPSSTPARTPDREKIDHVTKARDKAQRDFSAAARIFVRDVKALGILNDKAAEYFALIRQMATISCEWQLQEARMKLYGADAQNNFFHVNMIELSLEGAGMPRDKASVNAASILQDAHALLLERYVELETQVGSASSTQQANERIDTTRGMMSIRLEEIR